MDVQELQIQLRKSQSNLVNAGTGVILFAIWSVIRSILYMTSERDTFNTSIDEASDGVFPASAVKIAAYAMMFIITAFDMFLRFRIARNSIAEGKNDPRMKKRRKKTVTGDGSFIATSDRRNGHLVLSVILLLLYAGMTVFEIGAVTHLISFEGDLRISETVISTIVNLTSMYILLLILTSTRQIRTLSRQIYEMKLQTN